MLFIRGGLYDGRKPVVEPLSNPVIMLRNHTHSRLASDTVVGISQGDIISETVSCLMRSDL